MLNQSRNVTSVIAFEGNPVEFRQYLKDNKHKFFVKVDREYINDTYTLTIHVPA